MLTLLLSLQVIASPTPPPAPTHYKILTKTSTELDLSAMGAPSQSIVMTCDGIRFGGDDRYGGRQGGDGHGGLQHV